LGASGLAESDFRLLNAPQAATVKIMDSVRVSLACRFIVNSSKIS